MDGFEAYSKFLAMKRHFTPGSGYDYHKYHGKIKASHNAFVSLGNARFLFERLGRHRDPELLMVATMYSNPKAWIGDLFTEEAESRFTAIVKQSESIGYLTKQQLAQFDPWLGFNDLFIFKDGYPPVLDAMLDGSFSPLILATLDHMTGGMIFRHWDKHSWDPVVKLEVFKLRALQGFVPYDADSLKEVVKNSFVNAQGGDRPA